MAIACDAVMRFAARHAESAAEMAASGSATRRARPNSSRSPTSAAHVPAHAPRDFHEALQAYWFVHLGVVTELNTWDSFCPGRLDQHLLSVLSERDSTTERSRASPRGNCCSASG